MTIEESKSKSRTPIEEIGRINLIGSLLSGTGGLFAEALPIEADEEPSYVSSHRLLLEGVDFDLVYTPLQHLGYKAVLSVLGPIYANNRTPVNLSVNLGLSKRFCVEDVEELWSGVATAVKEHAIASLRLDLQSSLTGLTISLSSLGKQPKEIFVQTPKPASGDLVCLSGNLGAAYMGLQLLEREKAIYNGNPAWQPKLKGYEFILQSYLSPRLNTSLINLFRENSIIPSSGIFITDGLAGSVKRLCRNAGLGAKIYLEKIPIASQTFAMAEELNIEATIAALNGGDDFQLLYTIPLSKHEVIAKEIPQLDIIGHLTQKESGSWLITPDGNQIMLKAQGWSE
jgi:thiamine-monophosphate kinase